MVLEGLDECFRRHLDAEVDNRVAVVSEDDLHQVLPDVVDISLHGGEENFPFGGGLRFLHERLQVRHRGLHRLGRLQHLRHDQLIVVEQAAHLIHPGHQGAVDDLERGGLLELGVQVVDQPVLRPFHDISGQALIQSELGGRHLRRLLLLLVERGEGRHRVAALRLIGPPEEQVFGELPLGLRDAGIALQALGVHDGVVKARLGRMVEKDRVQHLAPRGRQTKGDIGDSKDRLAHRKAGLDEADPFDGLHTRADVVLVSGAHREDQGVEDEIPGRDAVLLSEQREGALGDGELPLPRHAHPLLGILIDRAHHHGGPVFLDERHDCFKPLLAVLQVDRVDDRLPLAVFERDLQDSGVGGIDHEGNLDLLRDEVHEAVHIRRLVPVRVGETDVENLGAPSDLGAADLSRLLKLAGHDQLLELPGADDIGPFTDQNRAEVLIGVEDLDAAHRRHLVLGDPPRRSSPDHLSQGADVSGGGAAASADRIHPPRLHKSLQLLDEALGGFLVVAVLVGKPRVGVYGDVAVRHVRQRPEVVGHELRACGAVQADGEEAQVLEGGVERFNPLAGQHGPHRLDGRAHHQGKIRPQLPLGLLDADGGGLDVQSVLSRFQEQRIDSALDEGLGLDVVRVGHLIERNTTRDGDGLGARPHGSGDEADVVRSGERVR